MIPDRKRTLDCIKTARDVGNYDDVPILAEAVDPQIHLSRNDCTQPFSLICEKDNILVQMSGSAIVHFHAADVRRFRLQPGDHVYIPAGTPHRVEPLTESIRLRYKAREAGLEAVAWYCDGCGAELRRYTWDTAATPSQQAYWDACREFNESAVARTCAECGTMLDPIDLSPFRWNDVAAHLKGP